MRHDPDVVTLCVRAYLGDIGHAIRRTAALEEEIAKTRERARMVGVSFEAHGSGAANGDRLPDAVSTIADLQQKWAAEVAAHEVETAAARDICLNAGIAERRAVWLRYVEGKTWAEIGRILGYSEGYVRQRMAAVGARQIYYLMPEQYRRDPIPNAEI